MENEYRTNEEAQIELYKENPEALGEYINVIFEEFEEEADYALLLSQLRKVARIVGVSDIARDTGISRQGVQKGLSETGNPTFINMLKIFKSMGYGIQLKPLNASGA